MLIANIPSKFPIPFANGAGGPYIRPIPTASQIGIQAGAASLTDGFPPVNFQPVASGGTPPFGEDMNGVLNQVTAWCRWLAAGAPQHYDAAFATSIGGYPLGATLMATADPLKYWTSTVDGNTSNPDASGAGWTFGSLIPFTPVQQGTGVSQGMNIVKLGWDGSYLRATVDATDLGALASQIWANSQYFTKTYTNATFAPLISPALTGTPTAPTAATFDYSTRLATTAQAYNTIVNMPHGGTAYVTPGTYNFTVPANVYWIYVEVWGGGGGGGGSQAGNDAAGGGGGTGWAAGWLNLAAGTNVTVTIGGGGGGGLGNSSNTGGTGGTSSFGPYMSATGGTGGSGAAPGGLGTGGFGGSGGGGFTSAAGGSGASGMTQASFWLSGSGGWSPHGASVIPGTNGQGGTGGGPGGGGTGGANGGGGGDGGGGTVIIKW